MDILDTMCISGKPTILFEYVNRQPDMPKAAQEPRNLDAVLQLLLYVTRLLDNEYCYAFLYPSRYALSDITGIV